MAYTNESALKTFMMFFLHRAGFIAGATMARATMRIINDQARVLPTD